MEVSKTLLDSYQKIINVLDIIPGNPLYKEYAILNIQQAHHWTRELLLSNEEKPHPLCGTIDGGL